MILVTGSYYPAQRGGPDNSVHQMLSNLSADNHRKPLVLADFSHLSETQKKNYAIVNNKITLIDGVQVQFSKRGGIHLLSHLYLLFKQIVKTEKVYIVSFFSFHSLLTFILATIIGKPIIISPRGELDPAAFQYKIAKKKIYLKLFKTLFLRDNLIFHATSDLEKKFIQNKFDKIIKVVVVPNLASKKSKYPIKKTIDFKKGLKIGFLGRLHPKKNLENLITGFLLFDKSKEKRNNSLILAGRPDHPGYEQTLLTLKKSNKNIKFIGHVEGSTKEDFWKSLDILCMPSLNENFGNVVIEALARGIPVLTSHGTPWECLKSAGCGYWVPSDSLSIFQALLNFSYLNQNERDLMIKNSLLFFSENFDASENANSYWEKICNV